ncbi:SpoIIE family protein phosphatase [Streptomyces sp. NPDC002766]|uniref:PP2C family protein-serine/threonine phosphatase n=1 Tax=unclassified Streptomyces TaxID=2593676 RepID=UPI00331EB71E
MGGNAKRPGRPWGPARGACVEINELVELMRGWLDGATVSVPHLHRLLTPDHFSDGRVPELRQLRSWLSGEGLRWDLVEAVADLCHPQESNQAAKERLATARQLWEKSQSSPTVPGSSELLSVTRELLQAKDRTIEVYQDLQRARQAYEASEQGRHQALQVATVMFALLGQAQAKIVELARRIDALEPDTALAQRDVLETRLDRAQRQELELREQLVRAERERDIAQQVADHAARRVKVLERELAAAADLESAPRPEAGRLVEPEIPHFDELAEDAALDDVDRTLEQARSVLDQEHQAVRQAADDLGYLPQGAEQIDADGRPVTIVAGQTVPSSPARPSGQADPGLFATTPDNTSTSPVPARIASDMLRFAGAATRRIARGLDLDEIVMGLCRATVPTFADVICVYLRDPLPVGDERPSGRLVLRLRRTDRRVDDPSADHGRLPAHNEPHLSAVAAERYEVPPGSPLAEVCQDVRPVLTDSPHAQQALAQLLSLQGRTPQGAQAIVAPLRGRRRVIGVALFLRASDRQAFQADDLLVAAQLATHSALGIDKSVLYRREAYIADTLQRSMLPAALPVLPGIRLAARYLPAAQTARVGGDWYDAFPLPGGRVGLVVGDVMGHSMTSAAVMGQLRSTLKTLAGLDMPAPLVLTRLDEQAQELGMDHLATCLYAVYDPSTQQVTLASAGHPPPVLVRANGTACLLPVPPGAPIGVGGFYEAAEVDTPPGSTLLLYTDGLVESRLRDVDAGMQEVRTRCDTSPFLDGPPHLENLCDNVLAALGPGDRDDDIALLAAGLDGVPSPDQPKPYDPA